MSKFLKLKFVIGEVKFIKEGDWDLVKFVHEEFFINSNLILHFGSNDDIPCDGATADKYSSCEGSFLRLSEEGIKVVDEICFRSIPCDEISDQSFAEGYEYAFVANTVEDILAQLNGK